jgi:hypothetical protein
MGTFSDSYVSGVLFATPALGCTTCGDQLSSVPRLQVCDGLVRLRAAGRLAVSTRRRGQRFHGLECHSPQE